MFSEFHFLRPLWLLALIPLAAAVVWLLRRKPGLRRWESVVDATLAPHVLIGGDKTVRRLPALAVGLAGLLAVGALAGPVWQKLPQPVFSSQDALVILLDLSQSMNVADIKPSRLERARFKIADILERRDEGQTALIVYAADAFTVSPLTDDTTTIASLLSALNPGIMPSQGSRADRALIKAQTLLQQAGRNRGDILLVTDGVNAERDGDVAAGLTGDGLRVSVLGVGTAAGGPIPGPDGFLKRRDGSIVIATIDDQALRAVASRGGGIYREVTADNRDIDSFGSVLDARQPSEISERELAADIWREEGPWLLLPLLPLVALVFRRGILVSIAVMTLIPPMPAGAIELDGLLARPDQRAARALEAGDVETAAELFRDPAWRAAAQYRAGQYDQAITALEGVEGTDAGYNRGNALARLGRYDEAVAAYDEVLEHDPDNADAKFNRDLILEQMQNQQQQSGDSSDQSDGEDQQQQSAQQDSQQGQQDQQDSQSGQSGDQSDTGEQQPDESQSAMSEEEQRKAEEAEAAAQQSEQQGSEQEGEQQQTPAQVAATDEPLDESEQAVEQWLRRIPDDPGGLLRRKFYYQYRQQSQPETEPEQW